MTKNLAYCWLAKCASTSISTFTGAKAPKGTLGKEKATQKARKKKKLSTKA
ncbi:hypothetical protein F9C07_8813 [Aspergillus flavus]|uniref:Uncharacterized protein n=1 Tax=Aspergillus flavus (strain ATCC 200026 / FGSC A1120 / IAM 13836 / NRRL 3357 / JCM 12722 / SRRC 167) TaxID=332952 RepID=A0A7U2MIX2_ASPFN|nr:hypothetical protein F9C07_8813 [Aspergillus flavus]